MPLVNLEIDIFLFVLLKALKIEITTNGKNTIITATLMKIKMLFKEAAN